jgi:hypothetical protein
MALAGSGEFAKSPQGRYSVDQAHRQAQSRHTKPEKVRHYFHPSAEAIAEVTSLLAPSGSRR